MNGMRRTTSCSATGLTMPQPTQHSLIHVLLLWTTILSIIQAVFIVLFFTGGYHGHHMLPQNKTNGALGGTLQYQANNPAPTPSELESPLDKGIMLVYKCIEGTDKVKWKSSMSSGLLEEKEQYLRILKDGYYYLTFQVTVHPSTEMVHTVSLKWNNKVLLEGKINRNTSNSTGLLGKVEVLSAGDHLEVSIDPTNTKIDTTESLTHLNVIYMLKP